MFNTPWYLVAQKQADDLVKIVYESNLEPMAQEWARENGGYVIATRKLIDDYQPIAPPAVITGPTHLHEGAVPKMTAEQPPAMPPGAVIQHETGDRKPVLFQYEGTYIEVTDIAGDANVLPFSPQVFADIMSALKNAGAGEL